MIRLKKANGLLLIAIAVISLTIQSFTVKQTKMKIKDAQAAPGFTIKDVKGRTLTLAD